MSELVPDPATRDLLAEALARPGVAEALELARQRVEPVMPLRRAAPYLHCCLCLHTRTGRAPAAETVINGQAVCYDHMGYVQGGAFSVALRALTERGTAT